MHGKVSNFAGFGFLFGIQYRLVNAVKSIDVDRLCTADLSACPRWLSGLTTSNKLELKYLLKETTLIQDW